MYNLHLYKPAIIKLCKTYKVKKLYAFGSVLNESFNSDSDIDLIVEFTNIEIENYADNYFDFKFSLQDILKTPIDLLEEQAIKNPYFKKPVKENLFMGKSTEQNTNLPHQPVFYIKYCV